MKKKLAILGSIVILFIFGGLLAYFQGLWIPNYPSKLTYPVRGIDVSHHQGTIQRNQVKNGHVDFVYVKATEGGDKLDSKFKENWQGSTNAGLLHGAYHFFTLKTSGKAQAENFIKNVPIEDMALPPVIDLEFGGNSSDRPSVEAFQRELLDFIDALMVRFNTEAVFYSEKSFLDTYLKGFIIQRLWIRSVVRAPSQRWTFWQFSERTRVPGINGLVDANVFFGSKNDLYELR